MAKVTSVIDIGSNSIRMAIFAKTSRFGFYLIEEQKSRVRISEGSYEANGYLQEEPMKRALYALNALVQIARNKGSRKILCVATSAVRDAPNRQIFLQRVKKECGIQIRIIDGEKEAFYGALACLNLLHKNEGMSIDVGGGSTEIAVLQNRKIQNLFSIDIGAIRVKELFFDKKEQIQQAKLFIQNALNQLPQGLQSDDVLAVGGSVRAMTKIILKDLKLQFFHGMEIDAQQYLLFCERILHSSPESLANMGFGEDRIDSIKSGALIFASFLEHLQAKTVITSCVGVREGVFLEDLLRGGPYTFPKNFYPSLRSLLDRFESKTSRAKEIKREALRIFDTLTPLHHQSQLLKRLLSLSSALSCIGETLGIHMQSPHNGYLAFHTLEYGFSLQERQTLQILLEHMGKKLPKENKTTLLSLSDLRLLISILSLAKLVTMTSLSIQYKRDDKNTFWIEGASPFVQEQIIKNTKLFDFKISFEKTKIYHYFQKVYPQCD